MQNNTSYTLHKSNSLTRNHIHYQSPLMVAWWSIAFPGFGHYLVNSYLWGFIFMSFEYALNTFTHLNLSIYYSMIGEFQLAKQVLDKHWLLLYIVIYIFAVWDSYRRTVELNKVNQLALYDVSYIPAFKLSTIEANLLDKKVPWVGLVWTILLPSVAYVYLQKFWSFIFNAIWWVVILYNSNLLMGVHLSAEGNFTGAIDILDPQWTLYLPSIYGFSLFCAYTTINDNNRLFNLKQTQYLKANYQHMNLDGLF
ncbi:hypothetical protein [Salinibacillus xinjiangensis]|uniref:Uncharacterized protein n=1 Tax=Salinibacillus xinjiangensis TaxID=1229268 RepID=A0A6G1X7G1_9BACI|nr:hypothetical protein [Salinibacillus xinjiangensis]MRG86869.1 hypothetical protein [Salinibacillus xinjiangensis]